MIKVINKRNFGNLFHYAHFICDCLFPEIINEIFKFNQVVREKNIDQTLGNFKKIYEEVMMIKNIELNNTDFINLNIQTIIYKNKENYFDKIYFDKFRNFIFTRYNINYIQFDKNYPEVILIKRYHRIELIDDEDLKKINKNITTGKERREINNIDIVEEYLQDKYNQNFKSLFMELISFEEQIKYFNNAKLIICAHGAVMSNMFFCKEKTTIIEVTCNCKFKFFDIISKNLNLNHVKINDNKYDIIINHLKIYNLH